MVGVYTHTTGIYLSFNVREYTVTLKKSTLKNNEQSNET